MKYKICSGCKQNKPYNEYHQDNRGGDGIVPQCKVCIRIKTRNYYLKNKEIIRIKNKLWEENNKDKYLLSRKEYYQKNKREINQKIWLQTKIKRKEKILKGDCLHCPQKATNGQKCEYHWLYSRKIAKERNVILKQEVFKQYGGKCICCDESQLEFLSIDHINGNGNQHRKEIFGKHTISGSTMYRWLKQNNYPSGFQVLCMNCNFAKGHFDYCPHSLNTTKTIIA